MKTSAVIVFVGTYAAFLVSSLLFRIDLAYYDALVKPGFTPPGAFIGVVWAVLYGLIAAAVTVLYLKVGFAGMWPWLVAVIVANWFFNQAYSYIQFERKDWLLATADAALIALTAVLFMVLTWNRSRASAWLFLPYAAWSTFATYLSWAIWSLNR